MSPTGWFFLWRGECGQGNCSPRREALLWLLHVFVYLIGLLADWIKYYCSFIYPSCALKASSQVSLNVTQLLTPELIPTLRAGWWIWDSGAGDWGCLSIFSDLCRHKVNFGEFWLAQSLTMVSCCWQALLNKVSAAQHWWEWDPKRVHHNFIFFLDRITWCISNKSIWSYSSSTVKHFANEFSSIIPNLQTSRLRFRQQIHLVQSQTMEGHWKLILWDPSSSLFTEQPTWSIILFFKIFHF